MITEAAEAIIIDALRKGQAMRKAQRAYFLMREQKYLTEAKQAERDFDAALVEADYAWKHGAPRPKQGELF